MLVIDHLVKSFGGEKQSRRRKRSNQEAPPSRVLAVNDVSFEVKEGELFTLLGPSGCGKTTTLRAVAGLDVPDSGRIAVGDRVMFERSGTSKARTVPANQRGLGMVFQSYAIWPHMTVFANVAFPLEVRSRATRPSNKEIAERVDRVLTTMELDHLADRQATKLSGGQQQRLALARALVIEPPLLLLDEPLSNLDAKLRESLRYELKRLQRELGITSIYVTHDQIEALALSTHIAVMKAGEIVQLGKPREIYDNPSNRFVAEFIGTSNFLTGTVRERRDDQYEVTTAGGSLALASQADVAKGSDVIVSIRPEALTLSPDVTQAGRPNVWQGVVRTRAFLGDAVDHIVAVGDQELRTRGNPSVSIEPGSNVELHLDPSKLSLVPVD
jgi:iron(III) transport system ATP-binding protein